MPRHPWGPVILTLDISDGYFGGVERIDELGARPSPIDHSSDQDEDDPNLSALHLSMRSFLATSALRDETRLPQRAYLAIRHIIKFLKLPPGYTVLERQMAAVLDMSRTPVREALVRLEMEGWVQIVPRRGFVVSPILGEEISQVYEIVEALDGVAGALAARRATPQQLAHLETLIQRQEASLEINDLIEWTDLDDQFHSWIIDLSQNPRLRVIVDSQADQIYRARLYTIRHRPKPTRSVMEHKAMLAALRAGAPEAAQAIMRSHRQRSHIEILDALIEMSRAPSTSE
jgi:DNA-binding GntR family transcriptional regulator